jgi:hypothetical protein
MVTYLRAAIFIFAVGLMFDGCVPRDFYSSTSPDGTKTATIRDLYIPPDYTVWFKVKEGWFSHTIYTAPNDRMPKYAEAVWQNNTRVTMLECDAITEYLVIGYDFGEKKLVEESARSQLKTLIMDKYKPSPELLKTIYGDPINSGRVILYLKPFMLCNGKAAI